MCCWKYVCFIPIDILSWAGANWLLKLMLNLWSSPPTDKSVYVADAGSRLPALRSPCRGHLKEPSLSHHSLHSATWEASRWDGQYRNQSKTAHMHKHRAGTVGLWPIRTGAVPLWCHCSGTFLCRTRLDLTLHCGQVTHMEVTKTHFLSWESTSTLLERNDCKILKMKVPPQTYWL